MQMSTAVPYFSQKDHDTWRTLYANQTPLRDQQVIPEFSDGLKLLEISENQIPNLELVNQKLKKITGWQGVFVKGFEGPETFYQMLANKKFPIGSFIRDAKDLSYTPEPDIFHDLYGHIPLYTIPEYAKFSEDFGRRGMKYLNSAKISEEFQSLFWFTIEFGLLKTKNGLRIFGSGIASSFSECKYALSGQPELVPFDIEKIREQKFRIDIIQNKLFVLESVDQLYGCLDDFEKVYIK